MTQPAKEFLRLVIVEELKTETNIYCELKLFSKMKNFLNVLIAIAIIGLIPSSTQASHIAAGDIYYEHMGGLNYRVHLKLYRDCNGIPLSGTAQGHAKDSSCNQTTMVLNFDTTGVNDPLNGQLLHSLCPNVVSQYSCANPPPNFTIYQYFHYAVNVTLPYACADWKFMWQSCCRNGAIANITNPGGTGTRIVAELDNSIRPNNSVRLTANPIPYICLNQEFQYITGPNDVNDLDSLVVEPISALNWNITNPAASIAYYNSPDVVYSGTNTFLSPLPVSPLGYVASSSAGTATFTPTMVGQYVLAFIATEYDPVTKLKVGSVRRDVQVSVVGCTTTPPTPTSPAGNTSLSSVIRNLNGAIDLSTSNEIILGVCPGDAMSFDIEAIGDTLNNLVTTSSDNVIAAVNSTYTSNPLLGGNPVTGSFTWTPTAAQIGGHTVTFFFRDSTCTAGQPIILNSKVTVVIRVLRGVSAGPDLPICAVGDSIILPALGPEDITVWTWSELGVSGAPHGMSNPNVQNPFVRPNRTTTYIVNTDAQSVCQNSDTITVYIDTSVTVTGSASPSVLCEPGITSLNAAADGPPPSYTCGLEGIGCATPSTLFALGSNATSTANVTPFLGSYNGGRCQLIYTQAELAAIGWNGPRRIDSLSFDVISKNSFGEFNMEIHIGCTYVSDINSFIPSGLTKKVFEEANYQTALGKNTFELQTPYVWDGVSNLVVDVCFFNLNAIGVDEVASTSLAPSNRYIGANSPFGGCQIPDAAGSTLPTISTSRPNIEFYACDLPATPWLFQWSGPYVFDSTLQSAQAYINSDPSKYVVYTKGGNGCLVWDTVTVNLSNHDVLVSPTQETICLNDRVRAVAEGIGSVTGESFAWSADANSSISDLSCTNCATPEITPTSTGLHVYTVIRTDGYGCMDTASVSINVLALPDVVITNGDTAIVRYGDELQLNAQGASRYSWTPSWGMNNPNVSSPNIQPSESALYTVNGLDGNGCGNQDEIYVIVDYSHNVFIPNAFSPNGDGHNDVFRIANFGYQRVSEFRVYNRWGQEVFSANDNGGWNGTFKGEPQDHGTYHYIIKAAFADSHVQTFKGDVILMR